MNLYWPNLQAFLDMGGYGFYVWSAYGVAAAVIVLELWGLRMHRKALATEIDE